MVITWLDFWPYDHTGFIELWISRRLGPIPSPITHRTGNVSLRLPGASTSTHLLVGNLQLLMQLINGKNQLLQQLALSSWLPAVLLGLAIPRSGDLGTVLQGYPTYYLGGSFTAAMASLPSPPVTPYPI